MPASNPPLRQMSVILRPPMKLSRGKLRIVTAFEPELMAMCADMGVGLVPYSPNGKGRLARPWGEQSDRSSTDKVVQAFDSPLDEPVVNAVQHVAEQRGITMAQVALAWVLRNPGVSAPIVGATKPHHLPQTAAALDINLTDDEARTLEEPYVQQGPSWY